MEEKKNNVTEAREIDLLALFKKLWSAKLFILKIVSIGFIIGLIISFSIPKEYVSTVILTPEAKSTKSGSMGSLAALAGINMNNVVGEDALASPELYPSIINSTPFLKGLLDIEVTDSERNIDTTLYNYIRNYQTAAWWTYILKAPGLLKGLFSSGKKGLDSENKLNRRFISEQDQAILHSLASRLNISSEKKTGVTTITVTMQSPEISAYIADTIISYLQSYIIDYRTQKARMDLVYTEELYEESKTNYYKTQAGLAEYIDANMNVVSAKFRTTQERLQNEAGLAYSVYNQMAQQLQMAKVKVQDTTPVFTVIQPAVQPLHPSKPSKKIILFSSLCVSFLGVIIYILRRDIFNILIGYNQQT